MNTALVFAGGTGSRMHSGTTPKQFLELHGKPIIIYTLEHFDKHPAIDTIAVVCLEGWTEHLRRLLKRFDIRKVRWLVPGGETSQASTRKGLFAIAEDQDPAETVVLIHDGVRPLIDGKLIQDNIESVWKYGSAITVAPAIETIVTGVRDTTIQTIADRQGCRLARAPQSFRLADILAAHKRAVEDGYDAAIDSATLMMHYGVSLHMVEGSPENIKITTPFDYYVFRAAIEARENMQILGI